MEDVKANSTPPAADIVGYSYAREPAEPKFALGLLVSVFAAELVSLLLRAEAKLLWYDELLTYYVSRLQPFSLLRKALYAGADGMPLPYYVVIRLGNLLPGDPHVVLRLTSIVGYLMGLLGVYWFVRRRLPIEAGVAAVLLMALSPFRLYATEARSYALLVGLLAIGMAAWQRIGARRFMTPLFGLCLMLGVSFHSLAVLAISPFAAAEVTWTIVSGRIRWGVWAACALATGPFLASLPVLLRFKEIIGKHFWSMSQWQTAYQTYDYYLGLDYKVAMVLLLFIAFTLGDSVRRKLNKAGEKKSVEKKTGERVVVSEFGAPEIVLIGGMLFYPALLAVVTKLAGAGYTPRYGWPGILGLVLGAVFAFWALWPRAAMVYLLGALIVPFALQTGHDFSLVAKLSSTGGSERTDQRWTWLAARGREEPDIPVVMASGVSSLEAFHYSPPELKSRLVQLFDDEAAIRLGIGQSDSLEKGNLALAGFIPLRVEDAGRFFDTHQRFLVESDSARDWVTPLLMERKYRLRLIARDPASILYIAER